ncbi:MAG: hypothetical protein QNJ45_12680 [Ardenticatenaceae bacterium]|nr:hypothetical protein [Ardenticatenaceae bacterium]
MRVRTIIFSSFLAVGSFLLFFGMLSAETPQIEAAGFCDTVTNVSVAECEALVALYNSTEGSQWTDDTNWLEDTNPCNWYGVICFYNPNEVDFLNLESNNLSGPIPTEINQLTHLVALNLGGNQLIGTIPPEIGQLVLLENLDLGFNQLTGTIPSQIGDLTRTTKLDLSWNDLSGEIPTSLGNLTDMQIFELADNDFTGEFPTWISNFQQLEQLYMIQTKLTGTVPSGLWDISTLEFVNLYNNPTLDWSLPQNIGNAANLRTLNLGQTGLHGPIPSGIGDLGELTTLYLPYNDLTGSLPASMAGLTKLNWLELKYNPGLTGEVPAGLAAANNMNTFRFENTGLCMPNEDLFITWFDGIGDGYGTSVLCSGGHSISGQLIVDTLTNAYLSASTSSSYGGTSMQTDVNGFYTITNLITGTFSVLPRSADHEFTPTVKMVSVPPDQTDIDFMGNRAEIAWVSPSFAAQLVYTDTENTNVTVDLPAGSVTETRILKIYPYYPEFGPEGFTFANHAFEFNAYESNGTLIPEFIFENPVTVSIKYEDSDFGEFSESALYLHYWDGSDWVDAACGSYIRDLNQNIVQVPICHLTEFALFVEEAKIKLFLPVITR